MEKTQMNMTTLFEKLNDLKTLFQYGEKIVPIIKSLVDFMQDTVPLLENINHSITDSASKIPTASNQINNVTSATEMATTEILDLIDVISANLEKMESINNSALSQLNEVKSGIATLKERLKNDPQSLQILENIEKTFSIESNLNELKDYFPKLKNDAYQITLSLQVQDITAQQLAAVNHLIDSVQKRLTSLINDIDSSDFDKGLPKIDVPSGSTFDGNASYSKNNSKQSMVDSILREKSEKASQDEIDKLFS